MYAMGSTDGYGRTLQDDGLKSSSSRSDERLDLSTLMTGRNIATLSGLQVQHPDEAASLCFDLALTYPDSVIPLLWNQEVAKAAKRLLREEHECLQAQEKQEMLARLLLEAGHLLPSGLSPNVKGMLQSRRARSDEHLAERDIRHQGFTWAPSEKPTRHYRAKQPCPYQALPKESVWNRNGKVNGAWCRHMALAAMTEFKNGHLDFKKHLRNVAHGSVKFNTAELERQFDRNVAKSRHSRVQFTPENFGRVLVRLFANMQPGERHAYPVGWWISSNVKEDGHDMCVLLEKAKDGMNKVWLYDPNVSGNAMHLRGLVEDLQSRSIADFDTRSYIEDDAPVLSIDIGDESLAHTWAGQFISHSDGSQMASFLEALANGTVHEMRAALGAVRDMGLWQEPGWRQTLCAALHIALSNGHAEAIQACDELLIQVDLDVSVWIAEQDGLTGFGALLQLCDVSSRINTAWAYLNVLIEASGQLDTQSMKALYRALYSAQTCRPFWTGYLCRVYSPGYRKLKVDPDFHQRFERLLAALKSG